MKISQKNRKIGYTYSSVSGHYPFRGEKSIAFESTLERDLLISLEYNPNVLDVIEQPITLEYPNQNGRIVSYTPDFLVHYHLSSHDMVTATPKSRLIEVKPNKFLRKKWPELRPKFRIGTSYAHRQGWIFNIYNESRIHTQYFQNVRFLSRYRAQSYSQDEQSRIFHHLEMVGHTAVDHLLEFLYASQAEKGIGLSHIWYLLAKQMIGCDMTLPLGMGTIIWLNTDEFMRTEP